MEDAFGDAPLSSPLREMVVSDSVVAVVPSDSFMVAVEEAGHVVLVWPQVGLGVLFSPSTIYILFPYSFRILVQNRVYILEYDKNTAPK